MKRLFLIGCLLIVFPAATMAQQGDDGDDQSPQTQCEITLNSFIGALRGDGVNTTAVQYVADVDTGAEAEAARAAFLANWKTTLGESVIMSGKPTFRAQGDAQIVSFDLIVFDDMFHSMGEMNHLTLRKADGKWKIVPDSLDTLFVSMARPDNGRGRYLLDLATEIAHPQAALNLIRATASKRNVSMLALGAILFAQDHNNIIDIDGASMRQSLMPYLKNESFFLTPRKPGNAAVSPYVFNELLHGQNYEKIADPDRVIAFYDGADRQLNFRYNNLAAVGFADGHAALVTPQEAKALRWKP